MVTEQTVSNSSTTSNNFKISLLLLVLSMTLILLPITLAAPNGYQRLNASTNTSNYLDNSTFNISFHHDSTEIVRGIIINAILPLGWSYVPSWLVTGNN